MKQDKDIKDDKKLDALIDKINESWNYEEDDGRFKNKKKRSR